MSKAHFIAPTVPLADAQTVRLGTTGAKFGQLDNGKLVKLAAESQYNLCAAGDPIEGLVVSVDTATSGGFSIGSIIRRGVVHVIADGLQATPGTGTVAVGDYVVTGTVAALGSALAGGFPKVCKATDQSAAKAPFGWRVVSLNGGAGAVGTMIAIERV